MAPETAHRLACSLRTLPVRVRQQNATAVAAWLSDHPAVSTVHHPSLATVPAAGAVGLPAGLLGLAALFVVRAVVAALRRHGLDRFVDNRPILLVRDGHFLDDNLTLAKVTRDDVADPAG